VSEHSRIRMKYGKRTDDRTGVREAINWLYIRVQNARKM
jgi:hypothetical protein